MTVQLSQTLGLGQHDQFDANLAAAKIPDKKQAQYAVTAIELSEGLGERAQFDAYRAAARIHGLNQGKYAATAVHFSRNLGNRAQFDANLQASKIPNIENQLQYVATAIELSEDLGERAQFDAYRAAARIPEIRYRAYYAEQAVLLSEKLNLGNRDRFEANLTVYGITNRKQYGDEAIRCAGNDPYMKAKLSSFMQKHLPNGPSRQGRASQPSVPDHEESYNLLVPSGSAPPGRGERQIPTHPRAWQPGRSGAERSADLRHS